MVCSTPGITAMEPPSKPDYYADLGLQQTATPQEIRRAHHALAKKHHPDKQTPGTSCADAQEFRRIQEAYEFLRDESKRATYDIYYDMIRAKWALYREFQQAEEEDRRRQRAEEADNVRREEEEERERRAARAAERERERERKCKAAAAAASEKAEKEKRLAREKEEREKLRKLKEEKAEERTREAVRIARERLEQAARDRLRQQKEAEAERRSREAAARDGVERERAARERLRMMVVEEKLVTVRENWARMREAAAEAAAAAETGENEKEMGEGLSRGFPHGDVFKRAPRDRGSSSPVSGKTPGRGCEHPRFGWPRKKGRAVCAFCDEKRVKFSFRCPECDVPACPTCRNRYCIM